ncbi:MAG: Ig-like domain-containing protein, partial [Terracidiphilus sp.]|nr:Ig-like domain-containing protein [Terracidiphilus sp.]
MLASSRVLLFRALLVAGLIAVTSSGVTAQSSPFTSIDVTGAGTGAHQGTAATAIDAAGDVTGIYIDKSGNEHAFVLPVGGTITPFDASGTGGSKIETIPIGFDTAGNIAGLYHDASNRVHGFVRAASTGAITILDVTGEDTGNMEGTFPVCINGSGEIAGNYSTTLATASGTNSFSHGFVRSATGAISKFDAVSLPTSYGSTNPGTYVISINASGDVAGLYIDGNGAEHGFLRDASGTITLINPPNAGTAAEQGSAVTGIDAAGDVIGAFMDSTNVIHGFVRFASTGTITPIDAPGAGTATYQGTYPDAIDAAGDVSGSFTDANNVVHGFVRSASGTIVTYDAPGSGVTSALRGGTGRRLNSRFSQLGKGYGLSSKSRRANSPLNKLRSLLSKVGAVKAEGTGLLNGNGPNPSGTGSIGNFLLNTVNASGEIVGLVTDGDYVFHGYLRAADGTITTVDDPNAGTAAEQGTGGLAINASGVIAGTYADTNSVLHGFIFDSSTLTATTTTLTPVPTPNPSVYGEPVTLTASVSSAAGAPPNGENVTFMNGAISLGTAPLGSGVASLTSTELTTGTDSITAVYAGDASFAGSTSTAVSQAVGPASSTTTLKSSLNPST